MLEVCVAILDLVVMCVRELSNILSFGVFDPTDLHILDNTFYKTFCPQNTESHTDLVQQEGNKKIAKFPFLGELSLEVNTKHEHPLTAGTQGCSCLFLTLKFVKYAELQKQSVSLIVISNGTLFYCYLNDRPLRLHCHASIPEDLKHGAILHGSATHY